MKDAKTQKMTFFGMVGNGKIQFLQYFICSYLPPLAHNIFGHCALGTLGKSAISACDQR